MFRGRRGVSEVLGVLLITIVLMATAMVYVSLQSSRAERETSGIVEMITKAEKRQGQLLSLTYYYNSSNQLRIYIYNYGNINSTLELVMVAGQTVPLSSITMKDMDTGQTCSTISPKKLVEVTISAPYTSTFYFTIQTEEGSTFTWQIVL